MRIYRGVEGDNLEEASSFSKEQGKVEWGGLEGITGRRGRADIGLQSE